ncbi:MAG TPA: phosphatase PAP2 family protein [bacterium]|nr:phosphatase PAP2 family protein [bacterium]HOC25765.1 phosphatase PAP2 family protein [bacterium]HPG83474.1 phosphatase PAP2 family protein [bacterium]HPM58706.1 phosphatase PAP2 family protein [bacterium]
MRRRKLFFHRGLCLLLLTAAPLPAAEWGGNYPDHIWQGTTAAFNNPRWLFAAGAVAGLSAWDRDLQAAHPQLMPAGLARFGKYYGFGTNYLAGSLFILTDGLGGWPMSRRERLDSWQSFSEAYAANMAATGFLKLATHRLRPDGSSRDSFPSGHASASACVAAHLQRRYGAAAGLPAAAAALITGASRLQHERHWLSDVLAGALLGGLIGDGFGQLERSSGQNKQARTRWQVDLLLIF